MLHEHPDAVSLSRYVLSDYARNGIQELRVRWNDLARTSLLRADTGNANAGGDAWGIVQDDGDQQREGRTAGIRRRSRRTFCRTACTTRCRS